MTWRTLRTELVEAAEERCARCGRRPSAENRPRDLFSGPPRTVVVTRRNYRRDDTRRENLVVLCRACSLDHWRPVYLRRRRIRRQRLLGQLDLPGLEPHAEIL